MDMFISVILILVASSFTRAYYDRKLLQEQYPGFGDEYIIFPGESDDEEIVGYLNANNDGRFFGRSDDRDLQKDVFFTFFSRNTPKGWRIKDMKDLAKYFDRTKKTKFITHGWLSSSQSDFCNQVKDAYLNVSDVNVIVMDWNAISGNVFYPIPMMATPDVGKHYGKFLNYLVNDMDASPGDIHLIGHSLGAHISGFAGRRVKKGKVGRVTGLDPALPGFTSVIPGFNQGVVEGGHLNSNDANFVDVIHTCAGFLGMKDPIGHVDFYPNGGGPPQPGCDILKFTEACSHGRSWKLFAESIVLEDAYMASECSSFFFLSDQKCDGKDIPMGEPTPTNSRGIYYVKTTGIQPYIWNIADFIDNNELE